MAEENQGSFKVTDRRLFNPDGTLRDDALIEESRARAAARARRRCQPQALRNPKGNSLRPPRPNSSPSRRTRSLNALCSMNS